MTRNCNILVEPFSNHINTIMSKLFFLSAIVLSLVQCKTQDYLTPYEYEGRTIDFGSGGGFTGKATHYTLMENGQIFSGTNKEGNVKAIKKISKEQCKQLFDSYDNMDFGSLSIDSPGNMYFYLTMNDSDIKKKLTWGAHDANESKELRVFHTILMNQVRKQSGTPTGKIQIK